MYEFLRAHQQVFMPANKEPHYFGRDLRRQHAPMDEREYLDMFSAARPDQRIGEASPLYLSSHSAAEEIRSFAPGAQIVIMLRDPVDMMHSLHWHNIFHGVEDIRDFAEALRAEPDRREGRRLPPGLHATDALLYREVAHFGQHVERYLRVFGRDRIHVMLYQDLACDFASETARLCEFLGIEPHATEPYVLNGSRVPRQPWLQRWIVRPPGVFGSAVARARRYPLAHRLRAALLSLNSRKAARPTLPASLRQELAAELAPDVALLEELIGRDLGAWMAPAHPSIPAAAST